jgi:hypothetical protein
MRTVLILTSALAALYTPSAARSAESIELSAFISTTATQNDLTTCPGSTQFCQTNTTFLFERTFSNILVQGDFAIGSTFQIGDSFLGTGFITRTGASTFAGTNFRFEREGPIPGGGSRLTTAFAPTFSVTQVVASAVPEPTTWAMMLAGFGMVGGALRSRRTRVSFSPV